MVFIVSSNFIAVFLNQNGKLLVILIEILQIIVFVLVNIKVYMKQETPYMKLVNINIKERTIIGKSFMVHGKILMESDKWTKIRSGTSWGSSVT